MITLADTNMALKHSSPFDLVKQKACMFLKNKQKKGIKTRNCGLWPCLCADDQDTL